MVSGVTRHEQLKQNVAAAKWEFPADHEAKIDQLSTGPERPGDPVRTPPVAQ